MQLWMPERTDVWNPASALQATVPDVESTDVADAAWITVDWSNDHATKQDRSARVCACIPAMTACNHPNTNDGWHAGRQRVRVSQNRWYDIMLHVTGSDITNHWALKHCIFAVRFGQSNPCLVADPSHAHFHLGRYLLAMREFYALHDMQQPQLGVSWKNLTVTATM